MRKILYVDDEEYNLITLEVSLRKWFRVIPISNPEDALDLIEKEKIQVVITDQRMPQMTGLELSRQIGMIYPDTIVIILTAFGDHEVMMEAINQGGIFRYLMKPWDINDLRQTLDTAFETYELRQKNVNLINHLLTQNRTLTQQKEEYRLIFESSPQGIAHFDNTGSITRCNARFADITGIKCEIMTGKKFEDFADKRLINAVKNLLDQHLSTAYTGAYHSSYTGLTTPVRVQLAPIIKDQNTAEGGIVILEDMTDKIKQEELTKQIAVVKESARFKQNFLANMSHEIRTPLTGVIGMTDILLQTPLSIKQSEYLSILRQSGEDLREIINQVLDFSKIEAGRINLKTGIFPFANLIDKAGKLFKSICKKNIDFEVEHDNDIPPYVLADEVRIMQIVNNLLGNAIKFTTSGTISFVSKLLLHTDDGKYLIRIAIKDTGKGIPPEQQHLLFTPFTQIDDHEARKFEGTGLGLSICRELAKLHGGDTGLQSMPGKGSTFWFTFMADRAVPSEDVVIKKESFASDIPQGLNILLVEDKLINQQVFSLMLKSMGYSVTVAQNGKVAIDVYPTSKFDLILMDIQMPVMNGITATQKLKALHKNLPPVVGLSANAFEGDREKYMHLGLDEYLTKPLKNDELIRVLKTLSLRSDKTDTPT
jgi:PAS domain S-box-containing protein